MKLLLKFKLKPVLALSDISIWFTPFAAAMLPIVFLAAEHSIEDIRIYEIIGPIIVTYIALFIGLLFISLFISVNYRVANIGTWIIILYWAYVLLLTLNEYTVDGLVVFRGLVLLPLLGVIGLFGIWFLVRTKQWSFNNLLWVNTMLLILLIFNAGRLVIQRMAPEEYSIPGEFAQYLDTHDPLEELPDIYYFIFDGYGRADVLKNYFDFDNSGMLSAMKQLGFKSLDRSSANYPYTRLSLTTTFNMQHLYNKSQQEVEKLIKSQHGLMDRQISFASSVVGQLAGAIGYELYAYNSQSEIDYNTRTFSVRSAIFSPFSEMLIDAGVFASVKRKVAGLWRKDYGQHNFPKHMPEVVSLTNESAPTLAFIYNVPPRPPLIFNRDGSLIDDWEIEYFRLGNRWIPGDKYLDQIVYVNSVLIETVEKILEASSDPPIIIVQSDHGPGTNRGVSNSSVNPSDDLLLERTGILNLMYLPDSCKISPRVDMTSVNTFRFIFSSCLGFEIPMLEDKLFWSLPEEIDFVPINLR